MIENLEFQDQNNPIPPIILHWCRNHWLYAGSGKIAFVSKSKELDEDNLVSALEKGLMDTFCWCKHKHLLQKKIDIIEY